ncbi:Peptide methionine sulfoxide reductase MsrB [Porphyridium purpureum]|uniref:Peptide methionine sulfoxide reductase MsrB n=1 Tax=Porphyridium purpureum TaxID=35688 RepID=A0A5J4YIL5_PORPP|nr:Peptide methionine sulfoxide reductase MsrB [Porphyridium purpureum]KAA8490670.1 Peptide methionine sulfoxide reductase MsrB [Porphyridium purpureum]|eukprot:POR2284..scf255_21
MSTKDEERPHGLAKMMPRALSGKKKKDALDAADADADADDHVPPGAMPRNITERAKKRVTEVLDEVAGEGKHSTAAPVEKVVRSEEEWKALLSENEFNVFRKGQNEKPKMEIGTRLHSDRMGVFLCKCCNEPLFSLSFEGPSQFGLVTFSHALPGRTIVKDVGSPEEYESLNVRKKVYCCRCEGYLGFIGMPKNASATMEKITQPMQINKCCLVFLEALVPKGSKRTSTRIGFNSMVET